jgi:UDPglucose 6-dehydrogenase
MSPDRVLIGSNGSVAGQEAVQCLSNLYETWVPRSKIITTSRYSAELAKIAANAFLAQRISSINSISALCEAVGASIDDVSIAIGSDSRIGRSYLSAGVGFGGACLRKDVMALIYLAESMNLSPVADYWRQVVLLNEWQKKRTSSRVLRHLLSTKGKKRVGVLGFAYKAGVLDTSETPAADVVRELLAEGALIQIFDPQVPKDSIQRELTRAFDESELDVETKSNVCICSTAYEACQEACAILVLTACSDLKDKVSNGELNTDKQALDWKRIARNVEIPALVFDGAGILDSGRIQSLGLDFDVIGNKGLAFPGT